MCLSWSGFCKWFYVLISLLCLATQVIPNTTSTCHSWDVFQTGRLDGKILRSLINTGPFTCMRECLLRRTCKSINFFFSLQECQLNYEVTSPNNSLKNDIHYMYWYHLEKSNMYNLYEVSPCNDSACGEGERCEVLANHSLMCSTTECQPLQAEGLDLIRATPKSSPLAVGSRVEYICSSNDSVQIVRYCQQSGQWRDLRDPLEHCVSQKI